MDLHNCEDIRSRLDRYADAVRETREHAAERSSFGRYRAGAPYFEQYPLRAALAGVAHGNGKLLQEYWGTYERITQELESPSYAEDRAYREELYRDLVAYVDVYQSAVCCSGLGMGDHEEIAPAAIRDDIGILLLELKGEFPRDALEQEVSLLDLAQGGNPRTGGQSPETSFPRDQPSGIPCRKKEQAGSR